MTRKNQKAFLIKDVKSQNAEIFKQAVELFEDKDEATHWLSTPKSSLGGETPLNVLVTDEGKKKVKQMLYRAEYGMFG